jgi:hypothetical protein
MPIDYKKYPANWKIMRELILRRADNECELCFLGNGHYVVRKDGRPYCRSLEKKDADDFVKNNFKKYKLKVIKIVLTIHHIDGNINNMHDRNLIALCQRCHLRLDEPFKLKKRKKKK